MTNPKERLEYLRGEIKAERISYEEIAELQSLAEHIDPDDTLLLQWAGRPENYKPVFKVNEWSTGFDVEHIPTGKTHWMSDGVDCLFDDEGHAYSPGEDTFRLRWELALNETADDTYAAYFPDLNPDDYDDPQIPEHDDTEALLRELV